MSKEAENKIAFEALEQKLDTLIESIKEQNRIISQTPQPIRPLMTIDDMSKLAGLSRKTLEYDIEKADSRWCIEENLKGSLKRMQQNT